MPSPSQRWFTATLLAVALFAGGHAWVMHQHARHVSRTGNESQQLDVAHQLIRPEFTADGNLWIQFAERLAKGEALRIRETRIDNAPDGREVHWSNGYAWWLAFCGRIAAWITDAPLPSAMEQAAMWANLPLLLVGLAVIGGWIARRHGGTAGTLAALALFGNRSLYGGFWPGNTDHHGIVAIALLGCMLAASALVDGITPAADAARLRGYARWSGIWGGVALWISAATTLPMIAAIGLAALVSARCHNDTSDRANLAAVWRHWGRAGAITSLALYALEYFPGSLGWRLEVNHPLYAVAWWAAAEFLAALLSRVCHPSHAASVALAPTALWTLPLMMLPAALIALWTDEVFWPADPLVAGLHGLILEFLPLWTRWPFEGIAGNFEILFVIPAFYALAVWLWRTRIADRGLVGFGSVLLIISHVMGIWQARWTGDAIFGESLLVIAAARAWDARVRFSRAAGVMLALLLTLPAAAPRLWETIELIPASARMPGDERQLLLRQAAAGLRAQGRATAIVIWAPPNTALDLSFYGGFRTLGTLYWENRPGLHTMARIAAAASDAEAEELLRRHAVTHLVFCTEDDVLDEIVRLARPGITATELHQAFASRVFQKDNIPSWLRALPDLVSASGKDGPLRVQSFAVDFGQSEAEAKFHLANVLAQRGETERALASFTRSAALGFAPAALRRAEFLLAAKQWDDASIALDQAIAGAPAAVRYRLLTQAGELLAEGGRHAAAAKYFERALRETVTDTRAANGLTWLLATSPESTSAQRDFALRLARQSTRLDPSVPEAWSALAAAFAANDDRDNARRALTRAEQLASESSASLKKRLAAQRKAYGVDSSPRD